MSSSDISVSATQAPLLQEVSVAVLAMSLREIRGNADRMETLIDSAERVSQVIVDPSLATRVDLIS